MKPKADLEVAAAHIKPVTTVTTVPNNGKGKVRYNKKAESEFFVDNSALAGFSGERILYMAVRELIENSLDSCENNHILAKYFIVSKFIRSSE